MPLDRVAPFDAVAALSNINFFGRVDGAGIPGSNTMTRVCIAHGAFFASRNTSQGLFCRGNGTNGDWALMYQIGVGFRFRIGGTGANVAAAPELFLGRTLALVATYDGVDARLRVNTFPAASVAVALGVGSGAPFAIGRQANNNPQWGARDFAILWCAGADDFVLPQAQEASYIATVRDDIEQGRDVTLYRAQTANDRIWDARDIAWGDGTWTDRVAAVVLTKGGTPERFGGKANFT